VSIQRGIILLAEGGSVPCVANRGYIQTLYCEELLRCLHVLHVHHMVVGHKDDLPRSSPALKIKRHTVWGACTSWLRCRNRAVSLPLGPWCKSGGRLLRWVCMEEHIFMLLSSFSNGLFTMPRPQISCLGGPVPATSGLLHFKHHMPELYPILLSIKHALSLWQTS